MTASRFECVDDSGDDFRKGNVTKIMIDCLLMKAVVNLYLIDKASG